MTFSQRPIVSEALPTSLREQLAGQEWTPAHVIYELVRRGHPIPLAARIACTPPISVAVPTEADARPGLEIFEAMIRHTPTVALALLRGTS